MANVMFKRGLLANLPEAKQNGTIYLCTDSRELYADIDNSTRIRLGDFQEFETIEALRANSNPSTSALYYISGANVLAKWNGTDYVQINLDTGMTSVEVVGDGNAITSASYNATTRKLTLTKGATYMTGTDVDGKIDAVVGEIPADGEGAAQTVRQYIDAKTAGIASDEALSQLAERVETAEGEIDALQKDAHTHANATVLDGITAEKVTAWDGAQAAAEKTASDALATAKTELEGKITAAQTAAEKVANDNNAAMDTRMQAVEGKAHEHANKAELDKIAEGDVAKWNAAEQNAKDYADGKVASVAAGDASVAVGGTATAPTVAVAVSADADNALTLEDDGLKVVIPAAAEYSIVKAAESGEYAAVYNLTKDGAVVGTSINIPKDLVVKSGSVDENGNIVLVLNDEENTEITIDASTLIEYVTSGSQAGDMIVVNVSDDHKVTATITDGTITLAKLSTDVQTAIGKAHTHANATVLDGIDADKVAAWDAAEQNAKDHADGLNTAMNTRVEAVEAKAHEHANADELAKIADGDVAKWNAAQANAEATAAAALKTAKEELEGKITAEAERAAAAEEKALSDAKEYANGLNTAMDGRVAAIEDDYLKGADKTELSNAIALKANAADVYAKTETYTKTEVDAAISGAALAWGEF